MGAFVYRGRLTHTRVTPVNHAFAYPACMLCAQLNSLDLLPGRVFGFGHNKPQLWSIWDRDHLYPGNDKLIDKLGRCLQAAGRYSDEWTDPTRVWLLTMPRTLMLGFNPLTLFVRTDASGQVAGVVAEVHNTYGEAYAYALPVDGVALRRCGGHVEFDFPKMFFVSPFNGLEGRYKLTISEPFAQASMRIRLNLYVKEALVMAAALDLRGVPLSSLTLAQSLARYPLNAALALPRIVWQGLMLRRKRLKPRMKPRPPSESMLRHAPARAGLAKPPHAAGER